MERVTPGQRPRPNYGHPHATGQDLMAADTGPWTSTRPASYYGPLPERAVHHRRRFMRRLEPGGGEGLEEGIARFCDDSIFQRFESGSFPMRFASCSELSDRRHDVWNHPTLV